MENTIKDIVIVGGGSAGWLTAGVLAAQHMASSDAGISITLIESPNVNAVGVGEGTWPSMRNTLSKIGIHETEFIAYCDASFKQGSKFINWRHENHSYYHPFMTPERYQHVNLHAAWQNGYSQAHYADTVNVQSQVCEAGLAPKQFATPPYAAVTNYGYHLDAGKFAQLLQRHCTSKLGVRHIREHIVEINNHHNGDIAAVVTKESGAIVGDLFIDCSGTKSLLLGQHYGVEFIEQKDVLFNDSAMAVQVPYRNENDDIASATLSTAQSAGWIWDIGLPTRRGVGYTYASQYCSDDEAQQTLLNYVEQTTGKDIAEQLAPRKLSFTPGYYRKFWHKNCVAIGMSAGFLEPLEASALALIELSTTMLSEQLPVNRQQMTIVAERYNQRFSYRWQRIIEFLKLHYVLSERNDSAYWRDNKQLATIPARLQELLTLWQFQPPSRYDFIENEEVFPSASYQYVLYGMGFNTQLRQTDNRLDLIEHGQRVIAEQAQKLAKLQAGLPTTRALVSHLNQLYKQNNNRG